MHNLCFNRPLSSNTSSLFRKSLIVERKMIKVLILILLSCFLQGCSNSSSSATPSPIKGEYIFRRHDESLVQVEPLIAQKRVPYPWEEENHCCYPKITKDFFRCKGSSLNPPILVQKDHEIIRYFDCGGTQKHSLPLRDQKEFIYPILIDLLNYIQNQTKKRVVITSGHCCPEHNTYLDHSPQNRTSKHMIGSEVDFYVQGLEHSPEEVIDWIFKYYSEKKNLL